MHTVNAGYESLKIRGTVRAEGYPRLHNAHVKCRKLHGAYVRTYKRKTYKIELPALKRLKDY